MRRGFLNDLTAEIRDKDRWLELRQITSEGVLECPEICWTPDRGVGGENYSPKRFSCNILRETLCCNKMLGLISDFLKCPYLQDFSPVNH